MPFVESGGFDATGWGDDELALACASHGGEPEHVAIAQGMLESIGLEEGDLACGVHEPLSTRGSRLAREAGARLTRLHNNCSGKHAAMLARAQHAGWPTYGYERAEHQVQRDCHHSVARWAGLDASEVGRAVDGCGVVEFSLPLEAMARAYARLAAATERGDDVPARIVNAMASRPFLIGGTDRFDTAVIEATGGRVISKIGAEGVHSVLLLDQRLGFALKIADGAQRAQFPAVVHLLQQLGALRSELHPKLEEFLHRPIRNTRGEVVGEVRVAT
jgi:L-asparaginase II